jgi:predicted ferric reductase
MTVADRPLERIATPGRRRAVPTILGVVVVGNLAVITASWFAHDGWPTAGSAPDYLTAAGQLFALYGTFAALIQVLLIARVPGLDGRFGMDRLTRWHRWTGFSLTWCLLAHVLFTSFGWASADQQSGLGEIWHLTKTELTVALASLGTVLLVIVAVSSVRAARRAVSYETWFYVHLLAYVMLAVSFPHIVTLGADFDHHKWTTRYWAVLYLLTIAAILWHRVGNPLRNARRHGFRLTAITPESPGVVSLTFTGENIHDFGLRAGQFVIARFRTKGWRHKAHPFSVSGVRPNAIRVTVKDLGDDSARVGTVPLGTKVLLEGPYGAFTEAKRSRRKVLLVAGGIGITPMRLLFERLHGAPGDVTLLYRSSADADVVFRKELDAIAQRRGFDLHYAVGSRDDLGDLADPRSITRLVPDVAERDVYLCGPSSLVHAAKHGLRLAGVPRRHLHHENFAF